MVTGSDWHGCGAEKPSNALRRIRSDTRKMPRARIALRARSGRQDARLPEWSVPAVRFLGTDPTKAFTVDESGKLVPNKQVQDYELSRAKAGRRTSLRWAVTWR